MTPATIERLAAAFWDRGGGRPPPPRDLEPLAPLLLNVAVRPASPVTPASVRAWCVRRGQVLPPGRADDSALHGCVVAYRGWAAVVVDDTLPPADRRVVVAHELGHFLAEYQFPRDRVVRRLGPAVLPVLDGDRAATDGEGWAATLAGVRLGVHAHYLERGFDPAARGDLDRAERTANALALELLAPRAEVLADPDAGDRQIPTIASLLAGKYGLPWGWADGHARRLAREAERTRPLTQRWGL